MVAFQIRYQLACLRYQRNIKKLQVTIPKTLDAHYAAHHIYIAPEGRASSCL